MVPVKKGKKLVVDLCPVGHGGTVTAAAVTSGKAKLKLGLRWIFDGWGDLCCIENVLLEVDERGRNPKLIVV